MCSRSPDNDRHTLWNNCFNYFCIRLKINLHYYYYFYYYTQKLNKQSTLPIGNQSQDNDYNSHFHYWVHIFLKCHFPIMVKTYLCIAWFAFSAASLTLLPISIWCGAVTLALTGLSPSTAVLITSWVRAPRSPMSITLWQNLQHFRG